MLSLVDGIYFSVRHLFVCGADSTGQKKTIFDLPLEHTHKKAKLPDSLSAGFHYGTLIKEQKRAIFMNSLGSTRETHSLFFGGENTDVLTPWFVVLRCFKAALLIKTLCQA